MDISSSAEIGTKQAVKSEEKPQREAAEVEKRASQDAAIVQISDSAKQTRDSAKSAENEKVARDESEKAVRELATV